MPSKKKQIGSDSNNLEGGISQVQDQIEQIRYNLQHQTQLTNLPSPSLEKWRYVLPSTFTKMAEYLEKKPSVKDDCFVLEQLSHDKAEIHFDGKQLIVPKHLKQAGVLVQPILSSNMEQLKLQQLLCYLKNISGSSEEWLTIYNAAQFANGLFIHVPSSYKSDTPIWIKLSGSTQKFQNWCHLIDAASHANASILIDALGADESWHNQVFHYNISANAHLQVYNISTGQKDSLSTQHHLASLQESASFLMSSLIKGSGFVRQQTTIDLRGQHASCDVTGMHLTQEKQQHHYVTTVNHLCPNTQSEQTFKGILKHTHTLNDEKVARASFLGKIHIAPQAIKTEAHQSYKALLLAPEAGIYAKPELEIYADDVKCSHGTATGAIDEDMLFYLMSRGFSNEIAATLITTGFLEEITNKIPDGLLRQSFLSPISL